MLKYFSISTFNNRQTEEKRKKKWDNKDRSIYMHLKSVAKNYFSLFSLLSCHIKVKKKKTFNYLTSKKHTSKKW